MRIFFSAGEPSGDLHAANLIAALSDCRPGVECLGFGGPRMAAAGCRVIFPLVNLSIMWFARVLARLHLFLDLASRADRLFRHHRPDAVVLIDYPGFNWWIARRAAFHHIPVFYYVPPQLWAWGGWRVRKMRRYVDHVLCSLPFEVPWYTQRGVAATHVGHPFFDELSSRRLDPAFLAAERSRGGRIVALLPGSRTQELEHNFATLLSTAAAVACRVPDARFLVAAFKDEHRRLAERATADHRRTAGRPLDIEVHTGRTPEIIRLAAVCAAVSGSVGLELLYEAKPSVVLYKVSPLAVRLARRFMHVPYISLVNLLAQRELMPEFLTARDETEALSAHLIRWLTDASAYASTTAALTALRDQVAAPGASTRAAQYILAAADRPRSHGGPHFGIRRTIRQSSNR